MNNFYEEVRSRAFSAFRSLAKEYAPFDDAAMLVGSADTQVSLTRSKVVKTIDTEWIDRIEAAIPALDLIIRNPSVAIEDVDEILPVELSKHITEKSIKHLAQHTNFILDVKGDEITPLKILNVFHEETALTYENKFVNTLLSRLSAFVDKRLRALNSANGIEMDYRFDYTTEFEHVLKDDGGRNSARINLRIELTSPLGREMSESDLEVNERYITTLNRLKKINMALISYRSSAFAERLGKNYVRPPVIRTNAILKNKNLRQCLDLWEFIEGYDRVGYSFIGDAFYELPSSDFVSDMYSGIALQYLTFYSSLTGAEENNRLISEKHLFETMPEFDDEIMNEELEDYQVYDSEYKKTVPVSRLMNNRKKLSEDEKKIRQAILIALRADEIINEEVMRREAEERRLAREKRLAEEAEAKRLAEEAARLRAEEEARLLAEEEARRAAAARHEVEIRYRRSFMSRYIQAEPYVQDYYTEIKNLLLSYRGVKSRVSWSKESFKCGRAHIAKMDVKGKSLYLYLAIDPALLEGSKYRFAVAKGDCPVLMKIKSDRKFKHATELIEMLMAELGLVKTETEHVDYHLPYEDTDALIERGLIKIILPKGEVLDEYAVAVKADLSGIEAQSRPEEAEPVAEAAEPDEDNEEGEDTEDTSADGEGVDAAAHELEIRYRRSFMSRLIQAEPYVQDYYTQIKNLLLSYRGVKARESWSKENFKCGRSHIAKIDVKGKSLYLYLNIDPEALEDTNYKFTPAKGDCPVLIKIKSERKLQHATELISMLMADLELVRTEIEPVDYHLPYEDTDALIARGLIKLILPKGESLGESDVTVKADLTEVIAAREVEQAEPTEAVLADEPAELINETEQDEVEIDSDTDDSENVDEDPTDSDTDDAGEPSESSDASANSREILIRYRRSFMSRYIQAEPYVQDYYTEIKNLILSYRGVKSRISWSKESFKRGRSHIAKMDVKGKSLYLYLAIDPLKLEGTKYNVTVAKGECPVRMKIRSDRKFKHAMELIAMLMAELEIPVTKTEPVDYHLPYEDTDALIARGLIKLILPKGEVLDENSITVKAGFLEIPTVQIRTAAEPEEAVTEPVVEPTEAEPALEETVEPTEAESAAEETVEPAEAEPTVEETVEPTEAEPTVEETVEPTEAEPTAEETVEPAEAEPAAEETVEPTEAESAAEVNEAEVEIFSEPVAEEPVCENEVIDESADALTEAEEYIEPVADEVLDELIEEEITVIGDEKLFEARVDDMIKLSIAGKTTVKYSDFGKGGPFISRTRKQAVLGFAFRGAEGAESACVIAPYTREEYLALPRKKKKGVQSTIKALLRYAATVRLLESLKTRDTENERIAERISLLENRLVKERRLLPAAKQWTDAVNRVTNEN